ncbi:hypothetical protein IEO21_04967 [Rhodonia placenta]|uniref:Uncharacterized protein n=1 Tax=Rhodonia placenta TaxID=104341 RepID=A0A8H7P2S9_9APHY|nr:hypothetical protein IEO21_04967 [Postia placenta]
MSGLADFERALLDLANGTIIPANTVTIGGLLIQFLHPRDAVRQGRDSLHIAMNVLASLVQEGLPVPDVWVIRMRDEHASLTIMADKLDNAIGAKVGFWSKIAMVKTISISRQVHTFVESAEDFRFTVQKTSDLAKSRQLGSGRSAPLTHHTLNSDLSLVSNFSTISRSEVRSVHEQGTVAVIVDQPSILTCPGSAQESCKRSDCTLS